MGRFSEIEARVAAGDFAGAEAICARMADAGSNTAGFWQMRGDIALMAGAWPDAEAHYRWAAALAPEAGKAWLGVARAVSGSGRAQAAGVAALRALGSGPIKSLAS